MNIKVNNLEDLSRKGVYKIVNTKNKKIYIGSTTDSFKRRLRTHINKLRINKHPNSHLQSSWNKYGEDVFEFQILECLENNDSIFDLEQKYITDSNCCNPTIGYNQDIDVYRKIRNPETNKKISNTLKRKYASGEIIPVKKECVFKGEKRPEFSQKMRGKKNAVEVSSILGFVIAIFRGPLDIEEYSKEHKLPFLKVTPHSIKGTFISRKMVTKYLKLQTPYKGLLFRHVEPLSPEMGIVKWVNSGKAEMPILSQAEGTPSEGAETTGEV